MAEIFLKREGGKGRWEEKGRGTGLCEAEPKNIMARQKMIYSMYALGLQFLAKQSVRPKHKNKNKK